MIWNGYYQDSIRRLCRFDKEEYNSNLPYETICADLFLDKSKVLKLYKPFSLSISYNVFKILQQIDNPHLVKLIEIYYSYSEDKIFLFGERETYRIDAYERKYIQREKINILKSSKDYLLCNIFELQRLFDLLSIEGVKFRIVNEDDVAIDSNGIVITNFDCLNFKNEKESLETLKINNRVELLYIIKKLIIAEYEKSLVSYQKEKARNAITDLFGSDLAKELDMASAVQKKLLGYKKPIQYVRKNME